MASSVIPYAGFVGGTYERGRASVSVEQCRNWIPERVPAEAAAKGEWVYLARPGLLELVVAGTGPRRAEAEQNGRAFVVSGGSLYELTVVASVWTATLRGTDGQLGNDGLPASMAFNGDQGDQLAIASNGNGFILTLSTNVLAQIADAQFPANVTQVVFWRGHFVWITENGTTFALSDLYDGTAYATADIGERQWASDYIQTVLVDDDSGELWLIGQQRTEVWSYNGALGFPAVLVPVVIPYGSAAVASWCQVGTAIYGLAQTEGGGRLVVRCRSGYGFEKISHHAVDTALENYTPAQIARAVAFTLDWQGHRFFILSIADAATWVYDEATDLWTQWDHWNSDLNTSEAFQGLGHITFQGTHVVGSRTDGTLYAFSAAALDDDGAAIRCVRRAPCVHARGQRVAHHGIYFDFEVGVGSASVPAPVGTLRWSDDAGKTWSAEQQLSLGAQGDYDHDAELRRLGTTKRKGRIYELVITDAVVRVLSGVYLEVGAAA